MYMDFLDLVLLESSIDQLKSRNCHIKYIASESKSQNLCHSQTAWPACMTISGTDFSCSSTLWLRMSPTSLYLFGCSRYLHWYSHSAWRTACWRGVQWHCCASPATRPTAPPCWNTWWCFMASGYSSSTPTYSYMYVRQAIKISIKRTASGLEEDYHIPLLTSVHLYKCLYFTFYFK